MNNELNINLIFDYIKNNNLTKTEFCRKCKISTSTFYKIVNGKDFKVVALFKMAKIMKLEPYRFFE